MSSFTFSDMVVAFCVAWFSISFGDFVERK